MSLGFREGIARAIRSLSAQLGDVHTFSAVALSGEVWQNRLLHELAVHDLRNAGFEVWWNQVMPIGDGGIALGQATLAAAMQYAPPKYEWHLNLFGQRLA